MVGMKPATREDIKQMRTMIKVDEDAFRSHCEEYGGWCLACGLEAYGVEPDARRYTCEGCGEPAVYGADEALIMGAVTFGDDES